MNHRAIVPRTRATAATLTLLLIGLAACQPKGIRPTAQPSIAPSTVDTTGAVRYQVDAAASTLHILVYRGGAMARLGHNHVVSSTNLSGTLLLHNDLTRSRLELALPVASLVVDDPQSRAAEGEEFAAEVPQDAREGTRRNLMRAEVLDAERFPTIALQSVAVAGTRATPSVMMRVTIKGVSRDVVVLASLQEKNNQLVAEGEFAVLQSDFGITPFSVGLGALQVQDRLRIRFKIVATL